VLPASCAGALFKVFASLIFLDHGPELR